MGGDGGGGTDTSVLDFQKQEDARKDALRKRINQLYGIDNPDVVNATKPTLAQFTTKGLPMQTRVNDGGEAGVQTTSVVDPGTPDVVDQAAYDRALAAWNANPGVDNDAGAARAQMQGEEDELAKATQDYYTEDLQHSYDKAKRQNTFGLADRGLLGGSAQVDSEKELDRDNTRGAGRIADEVRAAVSSLQTQRENERLQATQLINQGAGEEAIEGAKAGLTRAIANAASQQKVDITSDLFGTAADNYAISQALAANQGTLAAYRNAIKTFYNAPTSGGRVTASQ